MYIFRLFEYYVASLSSSVQIMYPPPPHTHTHVHTHTDGEIVTDVGGEDMMEGEEGGGWDVDDDELELPPDLVSLLSINMSYHLNDYRKCFFYMCAILLVNRSVKLLKCRF